MSELDNSGTLANAGLIDNSGTMSNSGELTNNGQLILESGGTWINSGILDGSNAPIGGNGPNQDAFFARSGTVPGDHGSPDYVSLIAAEQAKVSSAVSTDQAQIATFQASAAAVDAALGLAVGRRFA